MPQRTGVRVFDRAKSWSTTAAHIVNALNEL